MLCIYVKYFHDLFFFSDRQTLVHNLTQTFILVSKDKRKKKNKIRFYEKNRGIYCAL